MLRHHRPTPCFANSPLLHEPRPRLRPPSPVAVRTAPLTSARDFNVTDASRTARARVSGRRFSIFPQGCILPLPTSELSEMTCRDSLPLNRSCFVVIGTHTLRQHHSCIPRSSREYGPPRVISQRSEDYELSMNLTVPSSFVPSSTSFQFIQINFQRF